MNLKNKLSKQEAQTESWIRRVFGWPDGGMGRMDEEVRAVRSTKRESQNSHREVKYSRGHGAAQELTHDPWTWTMAGGLPEGVGVLGREGQRGKIGTTIIA